MRVIGMILSIGNILNGGTPKGQADGFDLSTLSKAAIVKDNSGSSMLNYICRKLYASDSDFIKEVKDMLKLINIKDVDLSYIKTKTNELSSMVLKAKGALDEIISYKEPHDKFVEVMQETMETALKEIEAVKK